MALYIHMYKRTTAEENAYNDTHTQTRQFAQIRQLSRIVRCTETERAKEMIGRENEQKKNTYSSCRYLSDFSTRTTRLSDCASDTNRTNSQNQNRCVSFVDLLFQLYWNFPKPQACHYTLSTNESTEAIHLIARTHTQTHRQMHICKKKEK